MNKPYLTYNSKLSCFNLLGIFLLIGLPLLGTAQSPVDRLLSMQKLYAQHPNFSMNVEVAIFVNGAPQPTPIKGNSMKQGDHFYSKIGSRENIINSNCMVIVNHDQKSLTYSPRIQQDPNTTLAIDPAEQVKTWKDTPMEFMKDADGKERIRLKHAGNPLASTELLIAADGRLLALTHYYAATEGSGQMRVEITYSNLDFNPKFDKNTFSEKRFIRGSGERAQPAANYPNYQIFNQFSR